MRNNGFVKALLFCLVVLVFFAPCWADALDDIVARTQSADPEVRAAGFEALQPYLAQIPTDTRAVNAVINLLVLETSSTEAPVDTDGEYFSDVITSVVVLNDPLSIPALVAVIGSGNMVPRRLAQYGSIALDPVVARAADPNWVVRKCVMITLANMLSPANLPNDPQALTKIKAALAQGALDPDPYVSESALAGLELTRTMFSAFSSRAETSTTGFELTSKFTLGSGSKGIDPLTQDVVLSLGLYGVTIPAHSFRLTRKGNYAYEGTINGVRLEAQITPNTTVPNGYTFTLEGNTPIDLSRPAIELTIGNDVGIGSVKLDK